MLKHTSGFALAEVVIAAAVFGLAAMALTGFYMTASARGALGQNVTPGALLAQQRIEVAQTQDYSNLTALQGTETLDELGAPSGRFTRVTTVTKPAPGITPPTDKLTQIQVTVSWSESGAQKSVTMYTLRVSP